MRLLRILSKYLVAELGVVVEIVEEDEGVEVLGVDKSEGGEEDAVIVCRVRDRTDDGA